MRGKDKRLKKKHHDRKQKKVNRGSVAIHWVRIWTQNIKIPKKKVIFSIIENRFKTHKNNCQFNLFTDQITYILNNKET